MPVLSLLVLLSLPAARADAQGIFQTHAEAIAGLGQKGADGAWLVGDDQVAALKQDLGALLGLDPGAIRLFTDPNTDSGEIAGHVVGHYKDGDAAYLFLVGRDGGVQRALEARNVMFVGTYRDMGGTERLVTHYYNMGAGEGGLRQGHNILLGTYSCPGDGTGFARGSIDFSSTGPDGEGITVKKDGGPPRVNGGSVEILFPKK